MRTVEGQAPQIVHEYYDAAVSGADPIDARPGFRDMLAYMLSNGVRGIAAMSALLLVLIGWTNPDSGWPGSSPDVPDSPICAESGLHNECGRHDER